jgi:HD-like signal output (HDOD) protein
METTQAFISSLAKQISIPDIYWKIRRLLDNPNIEAGDFQKLIQSDPPLATGIIEFANSEFFGFDRKTDGLYQAISNIGFGQLHDFLLGSLCIRSFCNTPGLTINFNDFWRQSVKRGIAARTIAKYCRLPANERFFTIGLLLEIGHAAMLVSAPELTVKSLEESRQQNQPNTTVERKYFGFDHCQLGAALLRHWHLPVIYQQIIQHYLHPEQTRPNIRKETDVAYLAHYLCPPSAPHTPLESELLNNHEQLMVSELIAKEINAHLDEVFAMLNPSAS